MKDIKVCCVTPIQVVQDFFDVTVNIYIILYIYIQADQQAYFNFSSNLTLHPSEGSDQKVDIASQSGVGVGL